MFSQVSVCPRGGGVCVAGGVRGRGHAWQGGMHGRGGMRGGGACMVGGGQAWREGAGVAGDSTRYGQ